MDPLEIEEYRRQIADTVNKQQLDDVIECHADCLSTIGASVDDYERFYQATGALFCAAILDRFDPGGKGNKISYIPHTGSYLEATLEYVHRMLYTVSYTALMQGMVIRYSGKPIHPMALRNLFEEDCKKQRMLLQKIRAGRKISDRRVEEVLAYYVKRRNDLPGERTGLEAQDFERNVLAMEYPSLTQVINLAEYTREGLKTVLDQYAMTGDEAQVMKPFLAPGKTRLNVPDTYDENEGLYQWMRKNYYIPTINLLNDTAVFAKNLLASH